LRTLETHCLKIFYSDDLGKLAIGIWSVVILANGHFAQYSFLPMVILAKSHFGQFSSWPLVMHIATGQVVILARCHFADCRSTY
jgi:hypothetical protein